MLSINHLGAKRGRRVLLSLFLLLSGNSPALCDTCARVVSLAPSISEVMVSLGLAENLVGVSRYDMPFEANEHVESVGGYIDPNYEQVLSLEPTIVFLLKEHQAAFEKLTKLGVRVARLEHRDIDGILDSVILIGTECGVGEKARTLREKLVAQSNGVTKEVDNYRKNNLPPQKVLILLGDEPGALRSLYVSGNDGFFSDLLSRVHAVNLYQDQTTSLQGLSQEGFLQLDPDCIIQIADPKAPRFSRADFLRKWQSFKELRAVRSEKIYYFQDLAFHIPGPRFIYAQKLLAEVLYPSLKIHLGV